MMSSLTNGFPLPPLPDKLLGVKINILVKINIFLRKEIIISLNGKIGVEAPMI